MAKNKESLDLCLVKTAYSMIVDL